MAQCWIFTNQTDDMGSIVVRCTLEARLSSDHHSQTTRSGVADFMVVGPRNQLPLEIGNDVKSVVICPMRLRMSEEIKNNIPPNQTVSD